MKTRVTQLLGIRFPVIQGGLAYLAYSDLAAAVSNAGGLGQITAMTLPSPEHLREEIRRVKVLTDKPFGVNFAIGQHGRPYEEMLEVALEEKVQVISITGGNPKPLIDRMKNHPVKKLVLVAAVRQAQKAEELGADAVMVVGHEGGGHLGRDDTGTIVLTRKVVRSVSIPVIASGGIADGYGLMAALALGAEGVEMGTRFIATKECVHAHEKYKRAIVEGSESDTVVIKRSLGAPGRALATSLTTRILDLEKQGVGYEGLKELISGETNRKYIYLGDEEAGFGWAGQAIGLIDDIPTVQELFERIEKETKEVLEKWLKNL
ncbi:NAD(P)H-dependent flavin oxidoreductase [Microaerobacter geothermalis]|uniref:NAD(P)H-dependent flavin oxidoreductase n=1 Tax=Microaerobacter geothermalis TaxID=674972 RepID=UPI0038B3217B